jgi:hypothetical protein
MLMRKQMRGVFVALFREIRTAIVSRANATQPN